VGAQAGAEKKVDPAVADHAQVVAQADLPRSPVIAQRLGDHSELLVTPMRHDQPIIARQVADAGAGIALRIDQLRATELRHAVGPSSVILPIAPLRRGAGRVRGGWRCHDRR
jgi:hypothetical protein